MRKNRFIFLQKHTGFLCLLLCAVMFFATGCGQEGSTKVVLTTGLNSNEVFRIETVSCYKPEMMVYITNMQNQYESVYGDKIWESSADGESLEQNVKDNALAKMAQVKTMNLMALEMGVELDNSEIKQVENAADKYFDSLNTTEIEALEVNQDTIYKLYEEYYIAQKVYQEIIKDINPEVSDDEARNIKVEYILIKTYSQDGTGKRIEYTENAIQTARDRAQTAYERAMDGENFEDLIIEYNEDDESVISLGKTDIGDLAIRNMLFDMANDEISPVFQTSDGFRIVKILSTYDIDETDANKIEIVEQQREAVFGEKYDEFVSGLTRKLNDPLWNSITFLHDKNITTSDFFSVADDTFVSTQFH